MGLKTDTPPIDARLSKIEAVIENIVSLAAAGNLAVNQLMERKTTMAITAKAVSTKETKWTMVMAKNVRQVVNQVVETLADTPKQEERKLNLRFTGFETKEGETEKKLVQQLNTKVLQGQMRLRAKVIATTWQRHVTTQASTSTAGACPGAVLLKFVTNKNR
jgi:Sec7-like guanine-nucleotide exchange factor